MKSYEVILFDLDGTITDSSEGITNSVKYMLKQYGIEENDMDKLCQFIGPPLVEPLQEMYGFSEDEAIKAVAQYRVYYKDKGIFENKVYEGFEDVLKVLKKKGKKVLVATSKPELFARRIMDYFHLTQYFDYVAGAGMDERNGSKAAVIEHAFEECNISFENSLLWQYKAEPFSVLPTTFRTVSVKDSPIKDTLDFISQIAVILLVIFHELFAESKI